MAKSYEGRDTTLEGALRSAQKAAFTAINSGSGHKTDFLITRVVDWGFRSGGFTQEENFYVKVEEVPTNHLEGSEMEGGFDKGGFDNGNASAA